MLFGYYIRLKIIFSQGYYLDFILKRALTAAAC